MKEQGENNIPPWSLDVESAYTSFKTSADGLSNEEVTRRQKAFGSNELKKNRSGAALKLLLRQLSSPLILILLGAAVITVILREPLETVVILLAIAVNAALGFYQEFKAEHTLEKLVAYIKDRSRVIRSGREREIDSSGLVTGDILRLSLGSRVPADARVVSVNNFSVDESILTGESLPIHKQIELVSEAARITERTNMVFAGSLVVEGSATAIVSGIGKDTEIGRIAELVSKSERELTPLQKALKSLGWIITVLVVCIVIGIFFLGISRGEPFFQMLLLSTAVAVGAIPEALPIALTVILTAGVSRIAGKKGIVRNLVAAETLGSTTVVMTDKTGTLTQAKMQLTAVLTKKELLSGSPAAADVLNLSALQKTILTDALVSTDVVIENPDDPEESWRLIGRPLEVNIALAARAAGLPVLSITNERRLSVLPFNSTNKFSVSYDKKAGSYVVLGAPDILLSKADISKEEYMEIEARIHAISSEGKRLLGIGRLSPEVTEKLMKGKEALRHGGVEDIEFLGVIVLYDPIRPEAAAAVQKIESYGAKVVMLTGDLKGTAMSIAREIGWEVNEGNTLSGQEIAALTDEELSKILLNIKIFSRVTPEDKLRIGRLYQLQGGVVAMTGDGVNDAPALKTANIGIALGSGSDVAKSAADLVVLDDNFQTIVFAIEEGRRVISNARKAFVYLMSSCLDEVILVGGSLIAGLPLPLTALQIIWVNFFTGSLPALAFAFEQNRDVGNSRASRQDSIFSKEVRILTIGIGVLTSFLLFILYWGLLRFGYSITEARTILFLCFASYILVVAFCFKSLHRPLFTYRLFDNKTLNLAVLVAIALMVVSLLVPALRTILDIQAISLMHIGVMIVWLVLNVTIVEISKWYFRKYLHR